jgi:hypothetical protein
MFRIGQIISNEDLQRTFRTQNQGGIRVSKSTNSIILILDSQNRREGAIYSNEWVGDELHFRGQGAEGDQELKKFNRNLATSVEDGASVHLFERAEANQYRYEGLVRLSRAPFQRTEVDRNGNERSVFIFPLIRVNESGDLNDAINQNNMEQEDVIGNRESADLVSDFIRSLSRANQIISDDLVRRFVVAAGTKRFVILTGLSGSGKTRLALAFAKWICADQRDQVCVVPVGADWTNREPLLGYQNALNPDEYIAPDALRLLLRAKMNWDDENDEKKPYFLILDEMNLSHVERYFSDFLSAIESDEEIPLHHSAGLVSGVPASVKIPKNLFVIGTVNVDETTYMFSPKVLDRANVIEFRVTKEELDRYLEDPRPIDFTNLEGAGADMAASFIALATEEAQPISEEQRIKNIFLEFFEHLKLVGAEFGFRSAGEMMRYCRIAANFSDEVDVNGLVDAAILQKLLPKLHGSRSKLEGPLKEMARLCLHDAENVDVLEFLKGVRNPINDLDVRFPLTLEKLSRMHRALIGHGFTSFAEA